MSEASSHGSWKRSIQHQPQLCSVPGNVSSSQRGGSVWFRCAGLTRKRGRLGPFSAERPWMWARSQFLTPPPVAGVALVNHL